MKKNIFSAVFVFATGSTGLFAQFTTEKAFPKNIPMELYATVDPKAFTPVKKANPVYKTKHIAMRPAIDKEPLEERHLGSVTAMATTISAFPNPFTSQLNIAVKDPTPETSFYSVSLFDLQGRKVFSKESALKNEKLELNGVAPGMYLLYVQKNGVPILQEKVIKE